MDSDTPMVKVDTLYTKVEDLIKSSIALTTLKLKARMALFMSTFAISLIVIAVVILIVLFLNIGLALWVGEMLGKSYLGFFMIGFVYFISMIIFRLFFYKMLKAKVSNLVIQNIMN